MAFRPSRTDTNPDTRAKKPQRAAVRPRPRHARVPHPANPPTERRARARSRASTDARRTTFNVCGAQKHQYERDDNFFRLRFARAHPHQHAKRHALFFRLVVVARARDRHATPRRRERRARDFLPETRDVSRVTRAHVGRARARPGANAAPTPRATRTPHRARSGGRTRARARATREREQKLARQHPHARATVPSPWRCPKTPCACCWG